MKKLTILLALAILPNLASAAMFNRFAFTGTVKSFDKENVVVTVKGHPFKVTRSQIVSGKLSSGEEVRFQISGEELQKHFNRKPTSTSTTPPTKTK